LGQNDLIFIDFATGKRYTIVEFVKTKFGLNYSDAVARIRKDSIYFKSKEIQVSDKEAVTFTFTAQNMAEAMHYWDKYKIPQNIAEKYAFYVKNLYRNEVFIGRSSKTNPIFVYKFQSGHMKIYRPLSPDRMKK